MRRLGRARAARAGLSAGGGRCPPRARPRAWLSADGASVAGDHRGIFSGLPWARSEHAMLESVLHTECYLWDEITENRTPERRHAAPRRACPSVFLSDLKPLEAFWLRHDEAHHLLRVLLSLQQLQLALLRERQRDASRVLAQVADGERLALEALEGP